MNASRHRVSGSDSHLVQVLDGYLAALQAGTAPDKEKLLAQYPELAEDLEACLASLDFIRQAAVKPAVGEPGLEDVDSPNRTLGDYRIVREIGRGGMGIVYEAEQVSLARRVALKVLPFAATLDPKQLQRFKNEAQAAAQLHHTNIVSVYGVGCERGVHFYAMQFIEGETLAATIRELRQTTGTDEESSRRDAESAEQAKNHASSLRPPRLCAKPSSETQAIAGLPTERSIKSLAFFRTVANLGVQAAEAVEHAHQLGVVHRDIKPANLLVDVRGNLWITDFGLAQFQSNAGLTLSGDVVGTLRYMSPEQALAKRSLIDHRTDIYSLGVTLYELLTLEPAFAGRDREELLRQITFEEPRSARRLNQAIPAELETIVAKAIEKNPAERYATAQELADDLRRFLEDKPIWARRPTLVQRLRKWGRRHRAVVGSAAVSGVLLLLVAVGGLLLNSISISHEKKRTEAEKNRAEEEKDRTRKNLDLALEALDKVYLQAVEENAPRDPQREKEYRCLLEDGLRFYEAFARENSGQMGVREETSKAYLRAANIHHKLGRYKEAAQTCQKAIALPQELAGEQPGTADHEENVAQAHFLLGRALMETGENHEAETAFRVALDLQQQLADKSPEDPLLKLNLAKGHNGLGVMLWKTGHAADAQAHYTQAMHGLQELVAKFPKNLAHQRELARTYTNQAEWYQSQDRLAQAEDALRLVLKIQQALLAEPDATAEDRRLLASTHSNLGPVLRARGRPKDAEKALLQAVDLFAKLDADFPNVPDYRDLHARAYAKLSLLYREIGQTEDAEKAQEQALALFRDLANRFADIPQYVQELALHQNNLAALLQDAQRLTDAEKAHRDAFQLRKGLSEKYPEVPDYLRDYVSSCGNLGQFLMVRGRFPDAEVTLREGLNKGQDLVRRFPNVPSYWDGLCHCQISLGALLQTMDRLTEAELFYRDVLAPFEHQEPGVPLTRPVFRLTVAFHYSNLAALQSKTRTAEEATLTLDRARDVIEKLVDEFPRIRRYWALLFDVARNYGHMAKKLTEKGLLHDAINALSKSLELSEKLVAAVPSVPDYQSYLGATLNDLAELRRDRGELAEARALVEKAIRHQQMARNANPMNPNYRQFLRNHYWVLAETLVRLGDHAEAARAATEPPRLFPESWQEYDRAVDYLARSLGLAKQDPKLSVDQRRSAERAYSDRIKESLQEAIKWSANDPKGMNKLAWFLANCPDASLRDPGQAVELAKKAVEKKPEEGGYWNTLAMAHYRAGAWQPAVTALEKGMQLRNGGDSSDWFVLAMAQWQLGEKDKARQWYERGVQWMKKNQPDDEDLRRLKVEAATLLGLNELETG
jgi:serine/threonine protein kinase/tetratricopeptide (TPR) repeat protein